jgi:hypothetical protein
MQIGDKILYKMYPSEEFKEGIIDKILDKGICVRTDNGYAWRLFEDVKELVHG